MTTFYSLRFETLPTWSPGSRIYIPQEQGGPVIAQQRISCIAVRRVSNALPSNGHPISSYSLLRDGLPVCYLAMDALLLLNAC
jgi:hypothetical protein